MSYIQIHQIPLLFLGLVLLTLAACSQPKDVMQDNAEYVEKPNTSPATQQVSAAPSLEFKTIRFGQGNLVNIPNDWKMQVELMQQAMFGTEDNQESFILSWNVPTEGRVGDISTSLADEHILDVFETGAHRYIEEWVQKHGYSLQSIGPIKLEQLGSVQSLCLEANILHNTQSVALSSCSWDCGDYMCTGNYLHDGSPYQSFQHWEVFQGIAESVKFSTEWSRIEAFDRRLTVRLPISWEVQTNATDTFSASWYDRMVTLLMLGADTGVSINVIGSRIGSEQTRIDEIQKALEQDIATRAAENNGNLLLTEPVAKLQDNTFLVGIEAVQELNDIDGKYYQRNVTLYYDCGINLCFLSYFRINAENFDEQDRDFLETFIHSSITESR